MPFAPVWTREAADTYTRLQSEAAAAQAKRRKTKAKKSTRAEGLFKQLEKCVRFLLENPKHPGLNTHEFHSIEHPYDTNAKVFEAYVQNRTPGAYRLFWCYGPEIGQITIIAITPHP